MEADYCLTNIKIIMKMDKLKAAAFDAVIDNKDELFDGDNKTQLALSAGMVAAEFHDVLGSAVNEVVNLTMKAANKASDSEEFGELVMKYIKKNNEITRVLDGAGFLVRFAHDVAEAAAEDMFKDSKEDEPIARFRNN